MLTRADGLPAVFWLYMNKDQLFASPKKIFLTIVNLTIFGIACAIVSSPGCEFANQFTDGRSVAWDYMSPERRSTKARLARAGHALEDKSSFTAMPNQHRLDRIGKR
jgi:hypothetical protein